ncbi:MAG: phosphate acyltransferase PlsX [Bdellovibrionales bacterium]|nr:phosphate acyltransferase PlsX [Bdellovibrionales bacterium]
MPEPHSPIAVDVMGGDHGPEAIVRGAVRAVREYSIPVILVGDREKIDNTLKTEKGVPSGLLSIRHAPEEITMDEVPVTALRAKRESSIRVAFELVKAGEASAVVSPGNTGAVMAAGCLISGTLPGIARPAIASVFPRVRVPKPIVLLDAGANVDCHAQQLVQFALMGHYYSVVGLGIPKPKVALLSNGTESSKGNDVTRAAYAILSQQSEIDFVGYVEGRDIPTDKADVLVCDGFVGNIVLKSLEGGVELVFETLKNFVEKSVRGKIGMWLARPVIKALFRDQLDPSSFGGAPLLGLNDVAIICHGSSGSRAISAAIRVADTFVKQNVIASMYKTLSEWNVESGGNYEDGLWGKVQSQVVRKRSFFKHKKKAALQEGEELPKSEEEEKKRIEGEG